MYNYPFYEPRSLSKTENQDKLENLTDDYYMLSLPRRLDWKRVLSLLEVSASSKDDEENTYRLFVHGLHIGGMS